MQVGDIKELRKTSSEKEVNFLLSEGWKIMNIVINGSQYVYLMARD